MSEPALIVATVLFTVLTFFSSFSLMSVLQQSGYDRKKYLGWLKRKDNLFYTRLAFLSGLTILSYTLFSVAFFFLSDKTGILLGFSTCLLFYILFLISEKRYAVKVPLKRTERIKRLSALYVFLTAVVYYVVLAVGLFVSELLENGLLSRFAFLPFCLTPLLVPFILLLSSDLIKPFENAKNKKYVKQAKAKLDSKQITRIAVVGSYGKTSVKNILYTLLKEKYRVVKTPESYNTPMGIAKTVLSNEFDGAEIFIAEMGAKHKGDISTLCSLVRPDVSVFTGVCRQHIETFSSLEKVYEAKSEVFEGTKGQVFLGASLKDRALPKNAVVSNAGAIKDVVLKKDCTSFTLTVDKKEYPVEMPLLGKTNVENVALCVDVALALHLTAEEILSGLQKLEQVPHRMQLIESGGVFVLDDSYNANELGAKEAVEQLKRFEKKKFILTPGIVEGGILEETLQEEFGKTLVGIDRVFLIGAGKDAMKKGYEAAGGKVENVRVFECLNDAQKELEKEISVGDAVLYLNDLPDVY